MVKKRMYFLLVTLLLLGTVACGKSENSTEEITTQEQAEVTTEEATEVTTTEATTAEATTNEAVATETETAEVTTEEAASEVTTESVQSAGEITPEEAQELLVKVFGTEDEETGNTYSFGHVNTMTVDGVKYHVFMWGWLVDDHVSKLTDLFVATDGSVIYEGVFVGDGATIYTETNYLE